VSSRAGKRLASDSAPRSGSTVRSAITRSSPDGECTAQLGHALVDSGPGRWNRYASDPRNLAFQRAKEKQQRELLRLFDKELQVTDPSDRPRIKKLLQQLVFRKGTI